ncbi:hypothetical protein C4559_03340 [Candidatus Microgenomates bacterium]|nr:MAG: hypothetical protein C4559_03340 [Candidatus Microgenomates bacterium]
MKKNFILLFLIIIIASFLRLLALGDVPSSPDWDETALGYNAFSIMQTGRDEYGKLLPLVTRSFDDYKPALYVYFVIPFIKLFGLNILATRMPSAIFGILTVLATYFLVKELLGNKGSKIALISSFLLAISPWHIQFSRIAFESNVGVAFNVLAILFFLKGLKKHFYLFFSVFFAGANLYVYQSEKVFTPLLFISLILIFRKQIFCLPKKYFVSSILLGFLLILPLLGTMVLDKEVLSRAKGVSIFADQTPFLKENVLRMQEDKSKEDFLGIILDNRRFLFAKTIVSGYISHFDFNWLFIEGDIPRHHAPFMGLLYIWELPFLLIGIYKLIFGEFSKTTKFVIFSWFLLVPIPASITSGVPHAVRTLNFLPTFQILTAIGVITFLIKISNIKYQLRLNRGKISNMQIKYSIYIFSFLFLIFNFLYYINQYFVQYNYFNSQDWQYGYKEAVSEVEKIESKYSKIVVSNKPHLDQSYMFFLFYLKYSPEIYQKEVKYASGGFRENHSFGKYEFRPIEWNKENRSPKILYVGLPTDFPKKEDVIKTIYFLNNQPAIKIVKG